MLAAGNAWTVTGITLDKFAEHELTLLVIWQEIFFVPVDAASGAKEIPASPPIGLVPSYHW